MEFKTGLMYVFKVGSVLTISAFLIGTLRWGFYPFLYQIVVPNLVFPVGFLCAGIAVAYVHSIFSPYFITEKRRPRM